MDYYIRMSFLIEIGLITVVLLLLYLAIYINRRPLPTKTPQLPEVLSKLDEMVPKLNRIISMIPVDYESTLHSTDKDIKDDQHIQREIIGIDAEIPSILPNRKFDTRDLIEG